MARSVDGTNSITYRGRACPRCGGTLRYVNMNGCVACKRKTVARYKERIRDKSGPKLPRQPSHLCREEKAAAKIPVGDPTSGSAFPDSIRHLLRAGHA